MFVLLILKTPALLGVTVEGPSGSNLPEFINVTDSMRPCGLSCPFNRDDDEGSGSINDDYYFTEALTQPCLYRVRVEEPFKGNVSVCCLGIISCDIDSYGMLNVGR